MSKDTVSMRRRDQKEAELAKPLNSAWWLWQGLREDPNESTI